MNRAAPAAFVVLMAAIVGACRSAPSECGPPPSADAATGAAAGERISLSELLAGGRVSVVNREATALGTGNAVRVTAASGVGLAWIQGSDLTEGTIEADVCGRDVYSESFVGIAFHRQDDDTYEAVYLRPFNFRSPTPDRRQHAVQYIAMPRNDYAHLRAQSPGEFEKPVDPSVAPNAWNHLRVVIHGGRVQAFVGPAAAPTLDVRALSPPRRGPVGLFVDNGSDGAFANLRLTKTRD